MRLTSFDIVITTYETVASDWKSVQSQTPSKSLFDITWQRVILDEGIVNEPLYRVFAFAEHVI